MIGARRYGGIRLWLANMKKSLIDLAKPHSFPTNLDGCLTSCVHTFLRLIYCPELKNMFQIIPQSSVTQYVLDFPVQDNFA